MTCHGWAPSRRPTTAAGRVPHSHRGGAASLSQAPLPVRATHAVYLSCGVSYREGCVCVDTPPSLCVSCTLYTYGVSYTSYREGGVCTDIPPPLAVYRHPSLSVRYALYTYSVSCLTGRAVCCLDPPGPQTLAQRHLGLSCSQRHPLHDHPPPVGQHTDIRASVGAARTCPSPG